MIFAGADYTNSLTHVFIRIYVPESCIKVFKQFNSEYRRIIDFFEEKEQKYSIHFKKNKGIKEDFFNSFVKINLFNNNFLKKLDIMLHVNYSTAPTDGAFDLVTP